MAAQAATHPTARAGFGRVIALSCAVSLAIGLILLAFVWPAATSSPRDVPLALVGPEQATTQLTDVLEERSPGAFDTTTVADRDAAVAAIEQREVYGAIVLGEQPEVLTAPAASPAVAQQLSAFAPLLSTQLTTAAAGPAQAAGLPAPEITVATTPIVSLSSEDPSGAGIALSVLPLIFGGLIGGVSIYILGRTPTQQLVGIATIAVLGGVIATAILHSWLGMVPGTFVALAAASSTVLFAMSSFTLGATKLIGAPGIGLAAVTFMLLGNPLAGTSLPPEFYPQPWGAIGQLLPPGAGAQLIRSLSYFPDASTTRPWLVLCCWIIVGLLLLGLGTMRQPKTA